jgi:type IV pilus assembly protein PilY1
MIDTDQPVTAAPAVATDGSRAWLYFGTGRFLDAAYDKKMITRQSFYGLKEIYNSDDEMQLGSEYGVGATPAANLVDVTDIEVINNTGTLSVYPVASDGTTLLSGSFAELNSEIGAKDAGLDRYNGWKINYGATGTALEGERTIGQAAILGDIVTFTSYVPSVDKCQPEGDSYLWAPYYRTGTSYYRSVIGTGLVDSDEVVSRKVGIGKGLATTPNIHTGAAEGSKAFIQTSTGAIVGIEQANPGVTKSGVISWRELSKGTCQ